LIITKQRGLTVCLYPETVKKYQINPKCMEGKVIVGNGSRTKRAGERKIKD
jgi:hypothetical protein